MSKFKISLQFSQTHRMAQFAQRLCLDLANTLTRDAEALSDLLKSTGASVLETEAQTQHLRFPRGKRL